MDRNRSYFTTVVICLMMIVLNMDTNVMSPTLAAIEREFGIGDAAIGSMMGLFTVIGAVVSLFWGYFADKASRKALFVVAILVGELPCTLTALSPNYTVFFLLRILSGVGLGAAYPLLYSIIGDMFDEKQRPGAVAIVSVAVSVGTIGGTLVGGYLGAENWRLPFVIASAPNYLFVLVYWFFTPEPRAAASEEATRALVASGLVYPRRLHLRDYAGIFKARTNLYLFIQGVAGSLPWGSFFFINEYLNREKGLSIPDATTVFLVFGVGMLVGNIAGGQLGGAIFRRRPRALPVFCAVTTLIGMAVVIYIVLWGQASVPILAALGFVATAFAGMTGPNVTAMILDVNAPENRGAVFSIFNLTDSLGQGFGKFVAGSLSGLFGLTASLAICSGFWSICAALILVVAFTFMADMARNHEKLAAVAAEMNAAAAAAGARPAAKA
jgi:predicted MFS family arabinose efflux permease